MTENIERLTTMLNETLNLKCNKIVGLQNKVIKSGTTTTYFLSMLLYRKFIQFYFKKNLYLMRIKQVVVAKLTTFCNRYEVMNNMVVVPFFVPNNLYSTDFFHFLYCTHE